MSATVSRLDRSGPVDFADTAPVPIQLGGEVYELVPQKLGRIRSRLGVELAGLEDIGEVAGGLEGFVGAGLDRAHRVLSVFIPDLGPVWWFCGYSSAENHREENYVEDDDKGPTLPQIITAFEVAFAVNRLDLLSHLKNVFSPELLRAVIQERALELVQGSLSQEEESPSATPDSPTSSATPGQDSPQTPSGIAAPTAPATL